MELITFADRIASVRRRVAQVAQRVSLDQYEENAFTFIEQRLNEMETECRSGQLKPAETRYPELGRIAEESDPAKLPPDLGGELIVIEKQYQHLKS